MADESKKPPAFFCPRCGQKHRADVSSLAGVAGGHLKATCRGCGAQLAVSPDTAEQSRCVLLEQGASAPSAAAKPAPAAAQGAGATGSLPTASAPAAPAATAPAAVPPVPPAPPTPASPPQTPAPRPSSPPVQAPTPAPKKGVKGSTEGSPAAPSKPSGKAEPKAAAPKAPAPKAEEKAEAPATPQSSRQAAREKDREKERAAEDKGVSNAEFTAGQEFGRYRIEEPIGRGGTGTVYRAFDPTTNRSVALKVLLADLPESMRQRFLREIEVQANIRHPNIMPVFDRGELPDGRPYFTMELLYKPFTLTEIVERRERGTLARYATLAHLAEPAALVEGVLVPVCDGIYVANVENGVIHRDLKPDNVLLDSRTLRPYVIDFGICQGLERSGKLGGGVVLAPTAEEAGIVGTPRFLSPEQARGAVHARTDVWGLGALVHFVITGEPPIAPASGITRSELNRRVEALREAREKAVAAGDEKKAALCDEKLGRLQADGLRTLDDLFRDAREGKYAALPSSAPSALVALVRKAMAPEPSDRYVNARQIGVELSAWAKGGRVRALAEAGGTAAAVDTAKRTLRGVIGPALAFLLGGLVGWAVGQGVGAGALGLGGDADVFEADLDAFGKELDALSRHVPYVQGAEAGRLYEVMLGQANELRRRMGMAPGGIRDGLLERAKYQADRISAPRVRVNAPAGYEWSAERESLDGLVRLTLKVGDDNRLAPGDWSVRGWVRNAEGTERTERVRVPLRLALRVRPGTESAEREPAVAVLDVPLAPSALPPSMVLVVGDSVRARQAPYAEPSITVREVRTFLLGRTEVTNSEFAQFLRGLPEAEAKERTPSVSFVSEPGSGRSVAARGTEDLPVVGVRPQDARAYAAWKGGQEGVTFRLPTEAEWLVAGGAALGHALPGGAVGLAVEGAFEPQFMPVGTHPGDVGIHGERDLLGNAREMVDPVEGDTSSGAVVVKGGGVGDSPDEAALHRIRLLKAEERHPTTGFRLARSL